MAREVNKLTALGVSRAKAPGRYGDGAGLYLVIDPGGSRRWIMIFRQGGRQREMGLGSANVVSLADARRRRDETHRIISEGRDPIAEKRRPATAKAITFGAFADALLPELAKGFRNEKHKAQWTSTLATYAASLRSKAVGEITTDDVLAVLTPIWTEKPDTASRVRGRIERVLDAAKAKGLREGENPARWRGHLDNLLSKRRKLSRGHHVALPFPDVPAFVSDLRARSAVTAMALEFTILTAARVGEALGARWDEIDRRTKAWTVPAERMKAGREHRVPLSRRALEILDTVEPLRRGAYVFPAFRADKTLSDMALSALLKRMGVRATSHGFRSSFRDWAGETTTFPRQVAEAALAHAVGDATELAYRRGDALAKRRQLMDAWDAYLTSGSRAQTSMSMQPSDAMHGTMFAARHLSEQDRWDEAGRFVREILALKRATHPDRGVETQEGKDAKAREASALAGQLVRAVADWAVDHVVGVASNAASSAEPIPPDDHRHESHGWSVLVDDSNAETVGREILKQLVDCNAGAFPQAVQRTTVATLESLGYGDDCVGR